MKKIAVVGCGISGLSFAYYLSQDYQIDLYEKFRNVGGLAQGFRIEDTYLEAFYHHFFKSDIDLINLLTELGLQKEIIYCSSNVSIYYKGSIEPFSTARDLLLFNRLPFLSRIIAGLQILYLKNTTQWVHLEDYSVKEWMEKYLGQKIYNQIWAPLLAAKFGDHAPEIPMSWLWGRIHPRSASREKGNELLGYLKGSFGLLFQRLYEEIKKKNGIFFLNTQVNTIEVVGEKTFLSTNKETKQYDMVVMAMENREIMRIVKDIPSVVLDKLKNIHYFGAVCFVLKLKKPLGNKYWINNADKDLPFSGVIEHTNFVPVEFYNNHSIAYIFKYLSSEDPFYSMEKEELYELFITGLKEVFSSFNKNDVIESFYFKTPGATPVYKGKYSRIKPSLEIIPEKICMINTSQIYPQDRNLNNGIALAKKLVKII